jgi:hypothetical protein
MRRLASFLKPCERLWHREARYISIAPPAFTGQGCSPTGSCAAWACRQSRQGASSIRSGRKPGKALGKIGLPGGIGSVLCEGVDWIAYVHRETAFVRLAIKCIAHLVYDRSMACVAFGNTVSGLLWVLLCIVSGVAMGLAIVGMRFCRGWARAAGWVAFLLLAILLIELANVFRSV